MKAYLDDLKAQNKKIRLMNYFDLKIPKNVIDACSKIKWKLDDAIKV